MQLREEGERTGEASSAIAFFQCKMLKASNDYDFVITYANVFLIFKIPLLC